jgi:hypothetical protein
VFLLRWTNVDALVLGAVASDFSRGQAINECGAGQHGRFGSTVRWRACAWGVPLLVLTGYCGGRRGSAEWTRSNMFISAFILVICIAAMIQFAVFSWRAGLLRTIATEPVGDEAELTAEICRNLLNGKDFADVSSLQGLCPDLKNGRVNLRTVRVYYSFLKAMSRLGDLIVAPGANGFGGWTSREMALCTQYTAAVLSQRLRSNQELAAEVRSY